MTRLASIVGVATVATLVLLSGCESAVKTDYAKKLDGTWMTAAIVGTVDRPEDFATVVQTEEIDVSRTVTVVIKDGVGNHEGTFTLTVTTIPTDLMVMAVLQTQMISEIVTTASGTINVKNDSELTVTITSDIINVPPVFPVPDGVTERLQNTPLPVSYELMDDELKLSSAILLALEVVMTPGEKLTLTR